MSLSILKTQALVPPSGATHLLEYAQGDLTNMSSAQQVDFLVVSALPGDYSPTPGSLIGDLAAKGVSVQEMSGNKAANFPNLSCWISQPISNPAPGIAYSRVLVYEPAVPSENGAKDVANIVQALRCFQGTTPTSLAMPLVCTGSGGADPSTVLRMSFYALAEAGGLNDYFFTKMIVAVYTASQAAALQPEFESYQYAYDELPDLSGMPGNYAMYASPAWSWAKSHKGNFDNLTARQIFGVRMYTSNYYGEINSALRKNDINDPDFIKLQPLFQACDTGLANIAPFDGEVYRGTHSLWNPFTPGTTVPIYSYLSCANPKGWWYNSSKYKFDISGTTSRSISSLSEFPDENEYLFPRGEMEYVDSRNGDTFTTHMLNRAYCSQA